MDECWDWALEGSCWGVIPSPSLQVGVRADLRVQGLAPFMAGDDGTGGGPQEGTGGTGETQEALRGPEVLPEPGGAPRGPGFCYQVGGQRRWLCPPKPEPALGASQGHQGGATSQVSGLL